MIRASSTDKTTITMASAIVTKPIDDLTAYEQNARLHSDEQIHQIAASITEFGFTNPILVDGKQGIIAGHGRLLAAKQLGLTDVPVVVLDHLTPTQKQAYIIADNKLAENASWDDALLAEAVADLSAIDYNLDLIGFDEAELAALFSALDEDVDNTVAEDPVPEVADKPVSQSGQLWLLGEHKLLCADATNKASFNQLFGDELAQMTFADPPYNVNYRTLLTAKKPDDYRKRSKQHLISNDNLKTDFSRFLEPCCTHILKFTQGAIYICMGASELHTLRSAFTAAGGCCAHFIVWAKNHFALSRSDYQRQYEMLLYGWSEGDDHFWCGARDQSDIWQIDREPKNHLHPTMKPVELCERAISNSSQPGDIVLDCFAGSGSTLIACEKIKRRARLMEIESGYVDVIIKRWQNATGEEAVDAKTGQSFDTLLAAQDKDEN